MHRFLCGRGGDAREMPPAARLATPAAGGAHFMQKPGNIWEGQSTRPPFLPDRISLTPGRLRSEFSL